MKLLVFAHTPPPFHGQSYMVQTMLEALGGDRRGKPLRHADATSAAVDCLHVNVRLSRSIEDVGAVGFGKLLRLLWHCADAIWCRFRYRVRAFYYVPAPAKRGAIYRDWITLAICRPFFPTVIFHWHASGLGRWIMTEAKPWERWLTMRLLGEAELSVVLASALSEDAAHLSPRRMAVVPNGIPDPCPAFETEILPIRRARRLARHRRNAAGAAQNDEECVYEVLFLGSCTHEKGVFDTVEAVAIAAAELQRRSISLVLRLTVAGIFVSDDERVQFEAIAEARGVNVTQIGFASGPTKYRLLANSDCFCFPTYYPAEALPTSVIEAMAFGLDVVATAWRAIPDMLPAEVEPVPIRDPAAVAAALVRSALATSDDAERMRERFLERFTLDRFAADLKHELRTAVA